jgi:hypothetical protein
MIGKRNATLIMIVLVIVVIAGLMLWFTSR